MDKEQLKTIGRARYLCKETDKLGDRWVRLNFGDVPRARIPRFVCRLKDIRSVVDYITALTQSEAGGFFGPIGADDINQVRRELKHNELTEAEVREWEEEREARRVAMAEAFTARPADAETDGDKEGTDGPEG